MTLSFEPFQLETGLDAQRALFRECFPETRGLPIETDQHYHWKFGGFPSKPASYEYVAADEAGFVGYYAALPFRYDVAGQEMTCGMVCDVMTAVRSRGQGVFTRLGKYALDELTKAGVDFVLGYPIRPEVIPGHLKVGWEVAFPLPMYLMPLRANALLAARKLGFVSPLVNLGIAGHGLVVRATAPRAKGVNARIVPVRSLLEDFDYDAFASAVARRTRQHLKKSSSFLRWRLSAPGNEYLAVIIADGRTLSAVSIVRATVLQGIPTLAVLDLELAGNTEQMAAMTAAWRGLAKDRGCEVVAMMMGEPHAKRLRLWRHGFLRTPAVFSLIIKRLSERAKAHVDGDPTHWNLMWIDSDDL